LSPLHRRTAIVAAAGVGTTGVALLVVFVGAQVQRLGPWLLGPGADWADTGWGALEAAAMWAPGLLPFAAVLGTIVGLGVEWSDGGRRALAGLGLGPIRAALGAAGFGAGFAGLTWALALGVEPAAAAALQDRLPRLTERHVAAWLSQGAQVRARGATLSCRPNGACELRRAGLRLSLSGLELQGPDLRGGPGALSTAGLLVRAPRFRVRGLAPAPRRPGPLAVRARPQKDLWAGSAVQRAHAYRRWVWGWLAALGTVFGSFVAWSWAGPSSRLAAGLSMCVLMQAGLRWADRWAAAEVLSPAAAMALPVGLATLATVGMGAWARGR
jgi:hypothetical protein